MAIANRATEDSDDAIDSRSQIQHHFKLQMSATSPGLLQAALEPIVECGFRAPGTTELFPFPSHDQSKSCCNHMVARQRKAKGTK